MTLITTLLGGSWHWLAALAGVIAALGASYFGGKKIGKVQQKARSDVDNAQQEASRVSAVAQQQQYNREEANRVATDNHSLDDATARDKLQQSKYHKP
jgi:multidrug resistance efflux pump